MQNQVSHQLLSKKQILVSYSSDLDEQEKIKLPVNKKKETRAQKEDQDQLALDLLFLSI